MRSALVFLALALPACTTDNPWFHLDSGQDSRGSTGVGPGGTSTSTSTSTSTGDAETGLTTAQPSTEPTVASAVTEVTGDVSSATDPVATASTGSGESGDSDSGETTVVAASTGDTGDSTTGEPAVAVYHELYPLCPAADTDWLAGAEANVKILCAEQGAAPEVFQRPMVKGLLDVELFKVLELVPSLEVKGAVLGVFGPFALTPAQQLDAELFTGLTCATAKNVGACDANASVWVRHKGQDWMLTSKPVKNGVATNILIKLWQIPGVNSGDAFEVFLKADVGVAPSAEDRLWFINPRIRGPGG